MNDKEVSNYHEILFNHFGYNYGFVADLLEKYFDNPSSVSDYWKNYFDELTGNVSDSDTKTKSQQNQKQKSQSSLKLSPSFEISDEDEPQLITGVGAKIIENMNNSLTIPTATSLRTISVKLLEENRRIINQQLKRLYNRKLSFTHIVAYALVQAVKQMPSMNNSFAIIDDSPNLVKKQYINLGLAVDIERKDGSRSLIVPNIKKAGKMNFQEFCDAYDDLIKKAKTGKIEPKDFQNSTITLTNPGGIGTVSSTPRLMTGQGCIIAVGAIDYPSEFKAMHQTALAGLGIGKVMNITSTYDHRVIQGAESGEFLKYFDELLLGKNNFYESLFEDLEIPQRPVNWHTDTTVAKNGQVSPTDDIEKQAIILQLINMYRVRGHLIANMNPLSKSAAYHEELDPATYGFTIWDYDRQFITGNLAGMATGTLREILEALHQTYCEMIGAEYMHIQNPKEKAWLQSKMEPVNNLPEYDAEIKKRIMQKLILSEGFEHFLHTRFVGHKRFSLEGSETLIPVIDRLLDKAANDGVKEVFFGMAHRGRLNVLSNVIGKSYEKIFSEFEEDINPDAPQGTGDVKYHLGANGIYKTADGKEINVSIASNPSHLEWVNPVVEGVVRAKQTRSDDTDRNKIIPVLIHGDAAFAGQGVVAETLNLSQLKGYRTGGTVHIIINNQIGFTTTPEDARSSPYATDVAKMVQAPIFHVNGDDPEASVWVTELAFEYRQKFKKDVVIDLFGYRRHGHNEGDDPVYTQPLMYKRIKDHPSVKEIYQDKLIAEEVYDQKEIEKLDKEIYTKLDKALKDSKKTKVSFRPDRPWAISQEEYEKEHESKQSRVDIEKLNEVVKGLIKFPENFALNPKLKKHIEKRKEFFTGNARIDWAFGEALAYGSLLLEGIPVRLSGQDSARGTFSQRHLILTDMSNGNEIIPHNFIRDEQALLEPLDSLLSEAAVLGFEFGYSAADPKALVMWEAQFGDFANGAQVIIDNFISSSFTKWNLPSSIVLLLPHGQEGQGPEHSSARLERFLILCAENNMYVANPTTPAQYFHVLRRQLVDGNEKPLVVMTPKSLLRLPAARSEVKEFTDSEFQTIIDDERVEDKSAITNLIFTSGKIYYDLIKHQEIKSINNSAVARIEQYYPLDTDKIKEILKSYPKVKKIRWVQEEPQNMGAWNFLFPKFLDIMGSQKKIEYVGKPESPSPSPGSLKMHNKSQEEVIKKTFK